MNWDISIGRARQLLGRLMQSAGRRFSARRMVLDGEAMEYAGRLQTRYGLLKHEAQWGDAAMVSRPQPIRIRADRRASRTDQ
jgi:hypothetical protein